MQVLSPLGPRSSDAILGWKADGNCILGRIRKNSVGLFRKCTGDCYAK